MHHKIVGAIQRIDSLEGKAKSNALISDPELQAQFAQLLCVHTSGLIETAVISILSEFSQAGSREEIGRYATSQLGELQNAKFEKLLIVLSRFDSTWRSHFEDGLDPEIKDAVDSIVNNKNLIAHGKPVGVSLGTFSGYYKNVKKFLSDLDEFVKAR